MRAERSIKWALRDLMREVWQDWCYAAIRTLADDSTRGIWNGVNKAARRIRKELDLWHALKLRGHRPKVRALPKSA